MIGAIIQGDLASDPVERSASNGKPYWTASARVATGAEAIFVGISTFDATAGARLMQLRKGSPLAAVGTLEATVWEKDGEERRGWRLTSNEILTAHQARKRSNDEGARHD